MFGLIVRVAQSTGLTENELHTTTIAENRRSHRPGVAISNNNGHGMTELFYFEDSQSHDKKQNSPLPGNGCMNLTLKLTSSTRIL